MSLGPELRPILPEARAVVREFMPKLYEIISAELGSDALAILDLGECPREIAQAVSIQLNQLHGLHATEDLLEVPYVRALIVRIIVDQALKAAASNKPDCAEISHRLQWRCLESAGLLPEGAILSMSNDFDTRIASAVITARPSPDVIAALNILEISTGVCWQHEPHALLPSLDSTVGGNFVALINNEGAARLALKTIRKLLHDSDAIQFVEIKTHGSRRFGVAIPEEIGLNADFLQAMDSSAEIEELEDRLSKDKFVEAYTRLSHAEVGLPNTQASGDSKVDGYEFKAMVVEPIDKLTIMVTELFDLTAMTWFRPTQDWDPFVALFDRAEARDLAARVYDRFLKDGGFLHEGTVNALGPIIQDGALEIHLPRSAVADSSFRQILRQNPDIYALLKSIQAIDQNLFRRLADEKTHCGNKLVNRKQSDVRFNLGFKSLIYDTSLTSAVRASVLRAILTHRAPPDLKVDALGAAEINLVLSEKSLLELLDTPEVRLEMLKKLCTRAGSELKSRQMTVMKDFDQNSCAARVDDGFYLAAERYMDAMDKRALSRGLFPNI